MSPSRSTPRRTALELSGARDSCGPPIFAGADVERYLSEMQEFLVLEAAQKEEEEEEEDLFGEGFGE
jgi:hypothetical protein